MVGEAGSAERGIGASIGNSAPADEAASGARKSRSSAARRAAASSSSQSFGGDERQLLCDSDADGENGEDHVVQAGVHAAMSTMACMRNLDERRFRIYLVDEASVSAEDFSVPRFAILLC